MSHSRTSVGLECFGSGAMRANGLPAGDGSSHPRYFSQGQEHRQGLGSTPKCSLDDLKGLEAVALVERNSVGLGVYNHANTAHRLGHVAGDLEHCAQEQFSDATTLRRLVDRETRKAENRQGVVRKFLSSCLGEVFDLDVPARDGCEAKNVLSFHRDVGRSDVMAKLVLTGKTAEEAV